MTALIIAIVGTLNIACFFIGAKVGQKVSNGEPLEIPSLNPIEIIREKKIDNENKRVTEAEQDRINTIMRNIENYNGTGIGQEEVPK